MRTPPRQTSARSVVLLAACLGLTGCAASPGEAPGGIDGPVLTNGDAVTMDEVVTGGGGYVSPGAGNRVAQEVADEALRCAEGGAPGEVAVFNPGSEVERG